MTGAESFGIAAECYIELVGRIRPAQWGDPGLGVWDVRSLVGHTSRALSTLESYLAEPAPAAVHYEDAVAYYLTVAQAPASNDDAIAQRGVEAGQELPEDPVAYLTSLAVRASAAAAAEPGHRIVAVRGGGIRLSEYLRTRVFELVVHTLDISRATGADHHLPPQLLAEVASLAAEVAAHEGRGEDLLLALTGRQRLPEFTIL